MTLSERQIKKLQRLDSPLFTGADRRELADEIPFVDLDDRFDRTLWTLAFALLLKRLPAAVSRQGWRVAHRSRRRSISLYLRKGETVVRISDHDVPMTDEREYNRAAGHGPQWTDEILLEPKMLEWDRAMWRAVLDELYAYNLEYPS